MPATYPAIAVIESLDREARGVARVDGKAVFVDGALPGEEVDCTPYKRKGSYDLAQIVAIRSSSPSRVVPHCKWFGVCGGCSLQHMEFRAQVAAKQRILEDALWHIGRIRPETMLAPVYGEPWQYRHRARFTVRLVRKKGGVLVGFHERRSSFVADMHSCEVVPARISALIPQLRELLGQLSIRERLPQIELAVGDRVVVLVLRVLDPPNAQDEGLLKEFAMHAGVQIWLQPGGPGTAAPFWPLDAPQLDYVLPEFDLSIAFRPTDFTQVNHAVNRMLVRRVLAHLAPVHGERVLDLFCGLGNFTLPIGRTGATVKGVEGSPELVSRAVLNASRNRLSEKCTFEAANLFDPRAVELALADLTQTDKVLIDPPREGAAEVVRHLVAAGGPRRLVYVSCDAGTLARDASVLVKTQGYILKAAGIVNMFPHTSHVESVALFEAA